MTQELVVALIAAIGYAVSFSIVWFVRSNDVQSIDDWQWDKFFATLIVAIGIAVGDVLAGTPFSEAAFEVQIVAYGGIIVLVQGVVQAVIRHFE